MRIMTDLGTAPSPPRMVVPFTPAVDVLLIDTDWLIAGVGGFCCYRNGCEFTLSVRINEADARTTLRPEAFDPPRRIGGGFPPEAFLLSVRWPSGAIVAANDWSGRLEDILILTLTGGTHHSTSADITYWLSPLPPPGHISFGIEWRSADVSQTWTRVDTTALREAASRGIEVGG
jgi:hypothetical protein